MAAYDDLNVKRILSVGIISVVVTGATALAVQVVYYTLASWQDQQKSAESNYGRQLEILSDQTQRISQYGVNEETGNITIPVDKAMELIIEKSSQPKSDSDEA